MKISIVALLVHLIAFSVSAQNSINADIKNTQWKGQIRSQGEVKMDFKKDTCYMYGNGNELISIFAFYQSQDTITVFKAGGGKGPCPVNGKGIYRIEMLEKGEKFYFRLIDEECYGRGLGLISSVFERIH